jgi:hypothetical protein
LNFLQQCTKYPFIVLLHCLQQCSKYPFHCCSTWRRALGSQIATWTDIFVSYHPPLHNKLSLNVLVFSSHTAACFVFWSPSSGLRLRRRAWTEY